MSAQPLPGAPTETPAGDLSVHRDGPVAWIIIDRPDRRNALSPAMWAALPELLHELDSDPTVRVIGLRGAGQVFSAGADIGEIFDCLGEPETGLPRGGLLTSAETALKQVRKPTVAALEGFCMGGAWMLAGACDLRIAIRSLRLGLTPARIGIIFPASGIENLLRLVGPGVASYLLLTGDTVTADDANRWGMLTHVIDDADFEQKLQATVNGLAQRSQLSIQAHKHLLRLAVHPQDEPVDFGADELSEALFRQVIDGPDARIGQRAFLSKDKPAFAWTGEEFWTERRHSTRADRGHCNAGSQGHQAHRGSA